MLIEPKGRFHQTPGLPLGLQVGSGRSLAIVLGKGWFGVERIDLRGATVHEQVNDPFGSRWKHRLLRSQRILRRTDQRWVLSQEPLLSKDTGQTERSESGTECLQKGTARRDTEGFGSEL